MCLQIDLPSPPLPLENTLHSHSFTCHKSYYCARAMINILDAKIHVCTLMYTPFMACDNFCYVMHVTMKVQLPDGIINVVLTLLSPLSFKCKSLDIDE